MYKLTWYPSIICANWNFSTQILVESKRNNKIPCDSYPADWIPLFAHTEWLLSPWIMHPNWRWTHLNTPSKLSRTTVNILNPENLKCRLYDASSERETLAAPRFDRRPDIWVASWMGCGYTRLWHDFYDRAELFVVLYAF